MTLRLVGIGDLTARWVYTRQGVRRLSRSPAFPEPVAVINRGRTKVWRLEDIEAYERTHPEVLSEEARDEKVRGYLRALRKGKPPQP